MRFQLLGPLAVVDGERTVALGGARQRATLGFLLLHLNRVVATSELLDALWTEEAPASARKILQNAIWGLRGVLAPPGRPSPAGLITRSPGYMLSVDPVHVDLHEFYRLVEQGRARLAMHEYEDASRVLGEALALWRGPALADLVESGLVWSELAVLQSVRLDVLEEFFEAELACGRHQTVLGELDRMREAHPLRERLCAQLMLALYRCGRQADALAVFGKVRSQLVDELGLEPSRELRSLQHAILTHDETLAFDLSQVRPPAPIRLGWGAPEAKADLVTPAATQQKASLALAGTLRSVLPSLPEPAAAPGAQWVPEAPLQASLPQAVPAQRKRVSVLMIRARLALSDEVDVPRRDAVLDTVAETIRDGVDCFCGTVVGSIGSVTLALFEGSLQMGSSSERAIRAALAVHDCLRTSLEAVPCVGVVPFTGVTTGEALVRHQLTEHGVPVTISGTPIDECQALLSSVPPGETWMCDTTRRETEGVVLGHRVVDEPPLWRVDDVRPETIAPHSIAVVDREPELELLARLLDRTRHRLSPYLVTVLGAAGAGKTRFLAEFQRRVAGHPTTGQFVLAHAYWPGRDGVQAVQKEILSSYCGIQRSDSLPVAKEKVAATARSYLSSSKVPALMPLIDPGDTAVPAEETTAVWYELIASAALDRGMVMVIDDLQCADDRLLGFIEELTDSVGSVPLTIIVAARPELIERRPAWSGGNKHATTFTLDPLSDEAIDRLLELLLANADNAPGEAGDDAKTFQLVPGAGQDARRKYIRMLLCLDRKMLTESAVEVRSN